LGIILGYPVTIKPCLIEKERIFMGNKIIIEDNTIYEIDEECIKRMEKQKIVMEERKNRARNNNSSNRNKNSRG